MMNLSHTFKRQSDLVLALLAGVILLIPGLIVALLVRFTSTGPVLYWSDRVGKNNRIFKMPKFRSMRTDTPAVATHLLQDPKACLTPIGGFLRKTSLDEIPQLWSILTGWAQINGRDELPIPQKVALDAEYLQRQSFWFDLKIIWLTALKVIRSEGVTH
jgi:O-antigen biosynthesis protein WbqP